MRGKIDFFLVVRFKKTVRKMRLSLWPLKYFAMQLNVAEEKQSNTVKVQHSVIPIVRLFTLY